MSYSAAIKSMEAAYRAFVHTALAQKHIGVPPPDIGEATETSCWDPNAVKKRKASVKGLHRIICEKLIVARGTEKADDEGAPLLKEFLEANLRRCAWRTVAEMAREIEAKAVTEISDCKEIARSAMEDLMALFHNK